MTSAADKILDIVAGWWGVGQFAFLLICMCMALATVRFLVYYFVVFFRGWPSQPRRTADEGESGEPVLTR